MYTIHKTSAFLNSSFIQPSTVSQITFALVNDISNTSMTGRYLVLQRRLFLQHTLCSSAAITPGGSPMIFDGPQTSQQGVCTLQHGETQVLSQRTTHRIRRLWVEYTNTHPPAAHMSFVEKCKLKNTNRAHDQKSDKQAKGVRSPPVHCTRT